MTYVYVLVSTQDDALYVGSTTDLRKRLALHNGGHVNSTKHRRPFNLLYYEAYVAEDDARRRERSLKLRGQSLYHLKQRISSSLLRVTS